MKLFVFAVCTLSAIFACSGAPQARIVGGDDAVAGQIPYQAALFIGGTPNCGAVILSEHFALTMMSCVCSTGSSKPWPPQLFRVVAGSVDLYTGYTDRRVAEITVNPDFSEFATGIALLRLAEPFVFSATIQGIALASQNPPIDSDVEISGWGNLKETEASMHRTLQINAASVVGAGECRRVLAGKADSQVICLGHSRKNGICRGDFGGPAVYRGQLVGVAAYLVGECGSALPDVFTSIASHHDWLATQMASSK